MKKKFIIVMLSLALTASSTACSAGKNNSEGNPGDSNIFESIPDDGASEGSNSEASEGASEEDETPDTSDPVAGSISRNTYENKVYNIKFTLSDGYRFATEEEIKSLNTSIGDIDIFKNNKAAKKALDDGASITAAYAIDNTKGRNVTVTLKKIGSANTEEAILEAEKETVVKDFEGQGLTGVTAEVEKVTFLGEEHPSLKISGTFNGAKLNRRILCLVKDNYISLYDASGLDDEYDAELLNATTLE